MTHIDIYGCLHGHIFWLFKVVTYSKVKSSLIMWNGGYLKYVNASPSAKGGPKGTTNQGRLPRPNKPHSPRLIFVFDDFSPGLEEYKHGSLSHT